MKRNTQQRISFLIVMIILAVAAGCASPQATAPAATAEPVAVATSTRMPVPPTAEETIPATDSSTATSAPESVIPQSGMGETIRYEIVPEKSEARYRVTEQLANLSLPNDAIGKTNQISGTITVLAGGAIDTDASQFVVDLSTLQSDRSMRDNFLRRNVLQTEQYPLAVFIPKEVSGLSYPLPQSGTVTFQLTGDLTIRDVTKEVTWEVTGSFEGDQPTGQAVTSFPFAYFNLTQPRVPSVLSIEDNITLEVDITLQPVKE